jgi:transposase
MRWDWDGTLERIHDALYLATREAAGRQASPTTAIIDSQSAKAAQKGATRSTRRVSTRARRSRAASAIFSSTRSASCSAGAFCPPIFTIATARSPCCTKRAAGSRLSSAFSPPPDIKGRKWPTSLQALAVGRSISSIEPTSIASSFCQNDGSLSETFASISRNRRLTRDFERYPTTVAAFVRLAMIRLMLKRLTRPSPCS